MCPILDGYGVMTVSSFPYTPSCEPRLISWRVIIFIQLYRQRSGYLDTWEVPKAWCIDMSGQGRILETLTT
jgi:hypothetical protein